MGLRGSCHCLIPPRHLDLPTGLVYNRLMNWLPSAHSYEEMRAYPHPVEGDCCFVEDLNECWCYSQGSWHLLSISRGQPLPGMLVVKTLEEPRVDPVLPISEPKRVIEP
jgi:hypothetical protein